MDRIFDQHDDITETFIDNNDGTFTIKSTQDVQSILDENAAMRTDGTNGWSHERHFKRKASIPMNVFLEWGIEAVQQGRCKNPMEILKAEHADFVRRKIDDNKFFRTDK